MKTAVTLACAALLTLALGAASAADVTGKWTGEFGGPDGGGMTITFNFKQDGVKLTGTVQGPGEPLEIKEGKVEGDRISFVVSFDGGGGAMRILHEGAIGAGEITLNVKMEGGQGGGPSGPMRLKRVK